MKRPDYVFADHKTHIVEALNDMCRSRRNKIATSNAIMTGESSHRVAV